MSAVVCQHAAVGVPEGKQAPDRHAGGGTINPWRFTEFAQFAEINWKGTGTFHSRAEYRMNANITSEII